MFGDYKTSLTGLDYSLLLFGQMNDRLGEEETLILYGIVNSLMGETMK
jgi:hypothetical protein